MPVTPVFFHGLGKVLPKGSWLPVPFFLDVFVGHSLFGTDDPKQFMQTLDETMSTLAEEGHFASWD